MQAYGYTDSRSKFELDHLIPFELAGNPTDQQNLSPELGASPNPKDPVENELRWRVCGKADDAGRGTTADRAGLDYGAQRNRTHQAIWCVRQVARMLSMVRMRSLQSESNLEFQKSRPLRRASGLTSSGRSA